MKNDDRKKQKKYVIISLIVCLVVYSYYNQYKESHDNYINDLSNNSSVDATINNFSTEDNKNIEDNKSLEPNNFEEIKIVQGELGKYGKKVFDEGEFQIFYYIPEGKYNISVLTRYAFGNELCFLWLENDSDNSVIEKLSFNQTNSNVVNIPAKSHIYNSNRCSYSLKRIN